MQKQDNNRGLNYKSLKGADLVGAFFMVWPSLWNLQNLTVCFAQESYQFLTRIIPKGSTCSEIAACFKMKIDHDNLHRNKAKKKSLNHITDQ